MLKKAIPAWIAITTAFLVSGAWAGEVQDAVIADPERYVVEFENDRVRIIRIKYGPGERSVMHSHGDSVAVMLTDNDVRFHAPDGSAQDVPHEVGMAVWADAEVHEPENLSDAPLEVVLVELKD